MSEAKPRTLFDKIWDSHVVERLPDGTCILYIDRHLLHEVTSPQAFEGLRMAGRKLRRPDLTIAVADHNIPTVGSRVPRDIKEEDSRIQVADAGEERRRVRRAVHPDPRCAAGHRAHHRPGAGPQPAGHDDRLRRQPYLDAWRDGRAGVRHRHVRGRARDGDADAAAAAGEEHADRRWTARWASAARPRTSCWRSSARSAPPAAPAMSSNTPARRSARSTWPGRMTVSNMTIEAGARAGLIAPDETTFDYIKGRDFAPKGEALEQAVAYWRTLPIRSRRALRHDGAAERRPTSRRW